jgi:hypothetical protein
MHSICFDKMNGPECLLAIVVLVIEGESTLNNRNLSSKAKSKGFWKVLDWDPGLRAFMDAVRNPGRDP